MSGDVPKSDAPDPKTEADSGWKFSAGDSQLGEAPGTPRAASSGRQPEVTWTASEFIAHQRRAGWYAAVVIVLLAIGGTVYVLTNDIWSIIGAIMAAILLVIAGAKRPQVLEYKLDTHGISMGKHFYSYSDFKSFSVLTDGAFASIELLPLKRFSPSISVYFAPEDQDKILRVLASHLPMSAEGRDLMDRLLHGIRL